MPEGTDGLLAKLDRLGRFLENSILITLLALMMVLGVAQIGLREIFNSGITWADELSRIAVLWLAMVAAIAACRENRHIRIDALSHLLPDKLIRLSRIVVDLFAAGVCAVIAWHSFRYLQLEIEFGDTVLGNTPAWAAHAIVPLAFALTAYRFVVGAFSRAVAGADERPTELPL